jgi:Pin2-interacting protein X1
MDGQKQSAGRHGAQFWKEEQGNFGYKMMSSMGWKEGKGLGKREHGTEGFVRAKKKHDGAGIGAVKTRDDTWCAAQGAYADVLRRLNEAVSTEPISDEVDLSEEKEASATSVISNYVAREALYKKFKKAKDVSSYSSTALAEIFGRATPSPPPASSSSFSSPSNSSELSPVEVSSLTTVTSSVSMKDYFAKKLNDTSKRVTKFQAASGAGFTQDFQTDYYNAMMDVSHKGRGGLGFGSSSHVSSSSSNPTANRQRAHDADEADESQRPSFAMGSSSESADSASSRAFDLKPESQPEPPEAQRKKRKKDKNGAHSAHSLEVTKEKEEAKNQVEGKGKKRTSMATTENGHNVAASAPPIVNADEETEEQRLERRRLRKEAKRLRRKQEEEASAITAIAAATDMCADPTTDKKKKKNKDVSVPEKAQQAPEVLVDAEEQARKERKERKRRKKALISAAE